MGNTKNKGYLGEDIVKDYYIDNGYNFVQSNFTIKGGELDLIFTKDDKYIFVEVKVVDGIGDLFGYITKAKIKAIEKTILSYITYFNIKSDYTLDFVFVKNGKIYEHYTSMI